MQRVITSVREKKFQLVVRSQEEVGGLPKLTE